jgi:AcrR family transcriptional regulator
VTQRSADQPAPAAGRRGRPRSEAARAATLAAASELMLEAGPDAVSMDAVAERAGVSKATIYRWWPSKERLALDALYETWAGVQRPLPDTGSLKGDLLALIRPWVRLLGSRPFGRVVAALLVKVQGDPEFADEYRARFVEPRRDQAREIFARAIARDEIPADTQVEVALDLLYGPVYHRLLHGHRPLNDPFARGVVNGVVAAVGAD